MNRVAIKRNVFVFAVLVSVISFGDKTLLGQLRDSDRVAFELMRRLDKNQDGFLTADEIPARSRAAIASAAKNAGLKINARKGISIEKLQKQLRKNQKVAKNDNDQEKDGEKRKKKNKKSKKLDTPKADRKKSNRKKEGNSNETPSQDEQQKPKATTKSFGKAEAAVSTKGFGTQSTSENDTSTKEPKNESGDSPSKKKTKRDKYARYAASMMRRHDKDGSGVLEKSEWQKIKGPTKEFDLNGDDVLDESELRAKLVGFSTNPNNSSSKIASNVAKPEPKKKRRSRARKKTKNNPDGKRRSFRFKTAHERVLAKVPDADWFVRLDRNKNGQIEMSEYSAKWSDAKVREFMEKDSNNDGIITPDELQDASE